MVASVRRTMGSVFTLWIVLAGHLAADAPAEKLLRHPDEWFSSASGKTALANLLSWQAEHGDWPKNIDTTSRPRDADHDSEPIAGTFDNGATTGELRVLARAFRVTANEPYRERFLRGLDHILAAQYAHGGWPQYYPLSPSYHRHITFNDGTMIRLMVFLQDATGDDDFAWLDAHRRQAASHAVGRGIDCILKCQVVTDGRLTVWGAQHDAESLAPVQGRRFEPASLSSAESAGILIFLMSLPEPSPTVVRAVDAGVAWFEATKIEGYRYRRSSTEPSLTMDSTAPPLWSRFYEIGSNRPIFGDRDGSVQSDLEQISAERRGGYAWYGTWGTNVLEAYGRWPHRGSGD